MTVIQTPVWDSSKSTLSIVDCQLAREITVLVFSHIFQAGFTVRSFEENWENFEWDQDVHFEELWEKGEAASDSFSQSSLILEPDHFLCLFLIMGFINSVGLIFLLWDILENPKLKFLNLMLSGMTACLLITFVNLFFFSTALLTPITVKPRREKTYGEK